MTVHLHRPLRAVMVVLATMSALVVLYLVVTFVRVTSMGSAHPQGTADVIVVMGAAQYDGTPSEMLERRLKTALELWNDKRATWIAVTGGKQEGDRFTEAGASAAWLMKRGVPEARIVREEQGSSTWESLKGLKRVLDANNITTAFVVSTDWHVARATESMRDLGFSATPASAGPAQGSVGRWLRETVAVAVGRIIGFDRLFGITG